MKLEFTLRHEYGRGRFYPANALAEALVGLAKRQCLTKAEVERLEYAGFLIEVTTEY